MKRKSLIPLVGLLTAGAMFIPSISMAQSATSTTQINAISVLLQQIQALQKQIDALVTSQMTLQTQVTTQFNDFLISLSLGSRGEAVEALQALLAANPDIYPEGLITGYFGKATERALKRLQKENGLEQVGWVGPRTRMLLNRLLKDNQIAFEDDDEDDDNDNDNDKKKHRLCAAVPPGHLIAPGWLRKHDGVKPIVPECQKLPKGIEKKGDDWKLGTTTPDVLAPIIRDLSATSTASTTASVTWFTNENAISTLWYSTTTPLNVSSANRLDNGTRKTFHSYNLSELTASTTYYYLVKVSDKANNSATTTEHSFITLGN
ncbi:MAG: peptidoglycan-binding protein [Candidatus Zambryskibacteria bacterium]|nr:peptidoglycan-binding protein [Candidatus Zambryskibacteria bacterium]